MLDEIERIEKRIQDDREAVNRLQKEMFVQGFDSPDYIREKISILEQDIYSLTTQVNSMKFMLDGKGVKRTVETPHRAAFEAPQETKKYERTYNFPTNNGISNQDSRVKAPENKRDMESLIGKSIMGILASILIFIGIILFATLLVPSLTDEIKIVVMFVFSIGLVAISSFKLYRHQENILYLSLAGCGFGATYISLFVTNMYFHAIDEVPLFVLLLLWAGICCFMSHKFSGAFQIIGEAGISISILLGIALTIKEMDSVKLFVLMIYFIIASLIYGFTHAKEKKDIIINNVFNIVNGFILIMGANIFSATFHAKQRIENINYSNNIVSDSRVFDDTYFVPAMIILALFFVFIITLTFVKNDDDITDVYSVFGAVYSVGLFFTMTLMFVGNETAERVSGIVTAVVIMSLLLFKGYKKDKVHPGDVIWKAILTLIYLGSVSVDNKKAIYILTAVFLFAALLYIAGILLSDKASKYLAMAIYPIYFMMCSLGRESYLFLIYGIALIAVYYGFMLLRRSEYSKSIKIIVHITGLLTIGTGIIFLSDSLGMDEPLMVMTAFVTLSIINTFAIKTVFSDDWLDYSSEDITKKVFNIVNAILMFIGLLLISRASDSFLRCIYIIVSVALFMLNSVNILKDDYILNISSSIANVYLGIKFTVLLFVILRSVDAKDYAVSIAIFILAITCIIIGFIMSKKALRMYGLVLSLISVVKLVLVDINYTNSVGRAVSFLVCGAICFGISAIYNVVDKRYKN